MGLSTSYYTVDGEIIGESTNGTRLDYLTDALGSVTAKVDQTGSLASSARYKPYGEKLSGSAFTFGWIGSLGYRAAVNGSYVRARHYSKTSGAWTTIDPLWPAEKAYIYVNSRPVKFRDYSGEGCGNGNVCCCCPDPTDANSGPYFEWFDHPSPHYFFGNYYNVLLSYTYHRISLDENPGDCSLEWWELSTESYAGCPANTWCEQSGQDSLTFDPWRSRSKPCRGSSSVTLPDRPHIGDNEDGHNTWERQLCIRVIHKKALGCHCDFNASERRAYQYLLIVNGIPRMRKFHHDNDAPYCLTHPFPLGT
jgi:RHS repeat-associated protein